MDPQEIKTIITTIQKSSVPKANKEAHFSNIYADFKVQYPMMFKIACESNLDLKNLDIMLSLLGKINKNEVTQHDASVEVGQLLYDKYVEPTIKANPKSHH